MHARYRSLLGQINWLQRVEHSCSVATSFPDVLQGQLLQQLVMWRHSTSWRDRLKSQPAKLQFWPLTGPLKDNWISWCLLPKQRRWIFTERHGSVLSRVACAIVKRRNVMHGSLIDHESQRIRRIVLSTTVAELYLFMKCCGSWQFLRGLWMDISGEVAGLAQTTW